METEDCSENNRKQSGAGGAVWAENIQDPGCSGLCGNPSSLSVFRRCSHKEDGGDLWFRCSCNQENRVNLEKCRPISFYSRDNDNFSGYSEGVL